ncbi:MAG TPA: hypothetical protein VFL95_11655 [Gemmatimonadales bacterium]|nr:hypothetical protein [Gemmatimonadales bacterium]
MRSGFWCAALLLAASPLAAQQLQLDTIPIESVDFYGLRRISDSTARRALGIRLGAPVPDSAGRAAALARLMALPGVDTVRFAPVCCGQNGLMLYVGVEEQGAPALQFNSPPSGPQRLPSEVTAAGTAFEAAFDEAIAHRDFAEDDTAGHALMHWPAARAVQLGFVNLANRFHTQLSDVLRHSADADQRALAAQVLAYATDKRSVVDDLVRALEDPAGDVRNNAMRALSLIALLAQRRPDLGITVPYQPMIALLQSPVWSDRNKASLALFQISAGRDPGLLAALRNRARPALLEMARWHDLGHATAALVLLGRMADLSDATIGQALQQNDRDVILSTGGLPNGSRKDSL